MRLWYFSSSVNSFFKRAHAPPSSRARWLICGPTLRLLPYFMCANSEGSGETARMLVAYVINTLISWAGSFVVSWQSQVTWNLCQKYITQSFFYTPVICNHCPHITGLMCGAVTFRSFPQCGGSAGVIILRQNSGLECWLQLKYSRGTKSRTVTVRCAPTVWVL